MSYELFYKTGTCALAVHVLLNEIGADYKLTASDAKEPNSKLLKVNPRGQVPTLVVDGEPITEGGAILSWLADTHQSPLLPTFGVERAKALQWLAFFNSSVHPLYSQFFHGGQPFAQSEFGAKAQQSLQKLWDLVEQQLGKTKYTAGDEITVGDILGAVVSSWTPHIAAKITLGEKTQAWVKEVSSRKTYQDAQLAEKPQKASAA